MSDKNIKNDVAWEALFEKYSILEKIHEIGYFEIESNSINEFRESRLMATSVEFCNKTLQSLRFTQVKSMVY
ncbi:MAG: hypothetical protein AN483_01815 [Aphanizomenon flos-aquae MDT14a]|jgi:hypothetical protein|nr:MAG: hypothetical protein AN483_01815 [Aphanizomenon flos-aquae MDT14a]